MSIMYYLIKKNSNEYFPIGELTKNKFFKEDGWDILKKIINTNNPKTIEKYYIKKDNSTEKLNVDEFLTELEKFMGDKNED